MNIKPRPAFFISPLLFFSLLACSPVTERDGTSQKTNDTALDSNTTLVKTPIENDSSLTREELLGKINPSRARNFVKVQLQYTDKSNIYMRKKAYESFLRMADAAATEGLPLQIISATRTFADQKRIWENKWTGQRQVDGQDISQTIADPTERALKILEYSSMPGTSRHHWGTDIDLNSLNNEYFDSGRGKKIYDWLQTHAAEYGFCQVYTEKGEARPYGYNEERWHWSYMPLSVEYLQQYTQKINYQNISGFKGAETAEKIGMIAKYVEGIAPPCKNWTPAAGH